MRKNGPIRSLCNFQLRVKGEEATTGRSISPHAPYVNVPISPGWRNWSPMSIPETTVPLIQVPRSWNEGADRALRERIAITSK
jgi:hypothetical protein